MIVLNVFLMGLGFVFKCVWMRLYTTLATPSRSNQDAAGRTANKFPRLAPATWAALGWRPGQLLPMPCPGLAANAAWPGIGPRPGITGSQARHHWTQRSGQNFGHRGPFFWSDLGHRETHFRKCLPMPLGDIFYNAIIPRFL